jgi:DNA topoisomerase-1
MNVVVVESPAKAKTINKYLGKDYHVLASFGHVRDLPSKDGSVRPDEDFAMTYEVDDDSRKQISAIAKAVKGSDKLILATDPDREGEAISWHVLEALKEGKSLSKSTHVERVVFNEITKTAILEAMKHPRAIDMDLVNAQQARRALDYLVGFTLSPVLWRKLPGSKSAGRVQSVALRLICDRDEEIEKFISQEYWDIRVQLANSGGTAFKAKLSHWKGKKLEKFDIPNEAEAKTITSALETKQYAVTSVDPKQARRHPYPPFTTSTLQQDASRKLGFGAKRTMQIAQKLYEGMDIGGETVGLITYMRTDGVTVSQEAIDAARGLIAKNYGDKYMPASPRTYKVKQKNAQEAHEAIRPTDVTRTPDKLENVLERDMFRLYELIWKRMMASQMESAIFDQMAVDIESTDKQAMLHATGSVMRFDGFLKLYQEAKDDDKEDEESRALPPLEPNEKLALNEVKPEQHFTEPPPRFTEASLVKKLEELGIGRPSTYASIISVLQERSYVRLDSKRFIAEARGRIVNAFLVSFFRRYVEYDFTAQLEERLDDVSAGTLDWKQVLREWWEQFVVTVNETKQLSNPQVLEAVDALLEPYIYRNFAKGSDPRACPACSNGRLGLKTGKFGAFLGCSNYPDCNYTKELAGANDNGDAGTDSGMMGNEPKLLGADPASGMDVLMKKGPYGVYVQLGNEKKPKRASVPKHIAPDQVTLEVALSLLALPREVGTHPETGKMITASIGRFGPYLLHDGKYTSIKGDDDVLTIGINRAVTVIAEKKIPVAGALTPLKTLGAHPDGGGNVTIYSGRYGPYIKFGKLNASLPKGAEPEQYTMEEAVALLSEKGKSGGGKKSFASRKKAPAKAATKTAAKPAAKKAAKAK